MSLWHLIFQDHGDMHCGFSFMALFTKHSSRQLRSNAPDQARRNEDVRLSTVTSIRRRLHPAGSAIVRASYVGGSVLARGDHKAKQTNEAQAKEHKSRPVQTKRNARGETLSIKVEHVGPSELKTDAG
jgi:hypothetical protein